MPLLNVTNTHTLLSLLIQGGFTMFGGYTQWAIVFLIIFVLFFLLVPGYDGAGPAC